MKELLLNINHEIKNGQKNAKNTKELYELLSSYNAYSILFLKAKKEYERKKNNIKEYYEDSDCYENQNSDLFSLFKNNECLRGKNLDGINDRDILFLIDQDTLLKINSFDIMNSNIGNLSSINYKILKINNCKVKVYNQRVYCSDPYFCESHYENKESFGLFYNNKLITPSYELDSKIKSYNNKDIRKILKTQSLDEIYEKITEAKNKKVKKLTLTK